jgi:ATP-dependent DNA ligase
MSSTSIYIRDFRKEIPGGLSDEFTWSFPTINNINAHNRAILWKIYVKLFKYHPGIILPNVPSEAFIAIEESYFDNDQLDPAIYSWVNIDSGVRGGKIKESVPTIIRVGKNVGKISATNVWTQALRDAYGLYRKQLKKVSIEVKNPTESNAPDAQLKPSADVDLFPPMLSQPLRDQKDPLSIYKIDPVFIQPKYNGVRTVSVLSKVNNGVTEQKDAEYEVIMYSRRKNIYPGFSYIKEELAEPLKRYLDDGGKRLYLDGEIYQHGVALQDISGYSRKEDQPDHIKCDYMIYDCFIPTYPDLVFSDRKELIDEIFQDFKFIYCKEVETHVVANQQDTDHYYNLFLANGFEGAMIRLNKPYKYSNNEYHSKYLLKIKPTLDAEYQIIGWETGKRGKAADALMIICQTEDGKRFPVTPALEIAARNALAKKMGEIEPNGRTHFENQWLGKNVIVYFDERSKDGVPQRGRTKLEIRTWD